LLDCVRFSSMESANYSRKIVTADISELMIELSNIKFITTFLLIN
jgi:hypothetical protein